MSNIVKYDLTGQYGIGYTTKGLPFYFDKEDYAIIAPYTWWIDKHGYVCATIKNHKNIKMHRLILNCPEYLQVDHIHQKCNDNRKSELRICTNQQNHRNVSLCKNNQSGKTGVCKNNKNGKWRAYITINDKQKSLGHYDSYEDAVQARIKAEKDIFKDFRYQKE